MCTGCNLAAPAAALRPTPLWLWPSWAGQAFYSCRLAKPMNITVYIDGTGFISNDKIAELVRTHFDLRPRGMIKMLDLLRPTYSKTATHGHFGRD